MAMDMDERRMSDQFSTVQELGAILRITDQAIYAAEMERVLREGIPEDDAPGDDVEEKATRLADDTRRVLILTVVRA